MRDNILKINKMLKESGSSIKYEIEINSGIYKIFKTKNGSGRNLVLHTTSSMECDKYVLQLLDFTETVYSMII